MFHLSDGPRDPALDTKLAVVFLTESVSLCSFVLDLLTIQVLVVVLLCPQAVLDDQAVSAREVCYSCRVQVTTGK